MEKFIDLHTHSCHSDGSMTPTELVQHASELSLAAIALTDHDCITGVREAMEAGERLGVEVVPGIELSARYDTETHILGYYIDTGSKLLLDTMEEAKKARNRRMDETEEKLRALGFDISVEDAQREAGGDIIGRAHFAKAMVRKGYVESVKQAFDLYLSVGRPGYSSYQLLTPEECVELINAAGGLAFVAHVHTTKLEGAELEKFLLRLKEHGLCGIEGYYTEYTPEMAENYRALAKRLGLEISGGTDFHAAMKPHIEMGRGTVSNPFKIPYSVLENIKRLHKERISL